MTVHMQSQNMWRDLRKKFAALMNEKAKKIGCTDSHFVTPNGLDAKDEQGGTPYHSI